MEKAKHILNIFTFWYSLTTPILAFPCETLWRNSDSVL